MNAQNFGNKLTPTEFKIEYESNHDYTIKNMYGKWTIVIGHVFSNPNGFITNNKKVDHYGTHRYDPLENTATFETPEQAYNFWEEYIKNCPDSPYDLDVEHAKQMAGVLAEPPMVKRSETGEIIFGDFLIKRNPDDEGKIAAYQNDVLVESEKSFSFLLKKLLLLIVEDRAMLLFIPNNGIFHC